MFAQENEPPAVEHPGHRATDHMNGGGGPVDADGRCAEIGGYVSENQKEIGLHIVMLDANISPYGKASLLD